MTAAMTDELLASDPNRAFLNAPAPVLWLIGSLVAIHGVRVAAGDGWYIWTAIAFSFIPAQIAGTFKSLLPGAPAWSFLSHAFLHGDWMHLLFNGLWLLVFGTAVQRRMGTLRMLAVSAIAAISGALATLALHWGEQIYLVGASGAISGLLAAAIPVMYGRGMRAGRSFREDLSKVVALSPGELLTTRPALIFLLVWLAVTLISGSSGLLVPGEAVNIAWEAHLGGFAGGLAAFYALDRQPSQADENHATIAAPDGTGGRP
jgi:membrane associated rhomboid family serine protease